MKREVHKLKHDAARQLKEVSKQAKGYGDKAHNHVMSHLRDHADSYIDKGVDAGADAIASKVKEKAPKELHGAIDFIKGAGAGLAKEKIKATVKPRLGKK